MHNSNGRLVIVILQVIVEFAQLHHEEHSLVDNGPRGKGADVGVLRALLELAAHHIESAVEFHSLLHILGLLDEALHDTWHGILGKVAQDFRVHRNISPAQEL